MKGRKATIIKIAVSLIAISLIAAAALTENNYAERKSKLMASGTQDNSSEAALNAAKAEKLVEQQRMKEEAEEQKKEQATFTLEKEGFNHLVFTNKVDGYSITVPKNMDVDMSFSNIRAVLENEELRIEIYRQKIENTSGSGITSYTNYSNQFIENDIDHRQEYKGSVKLDNRRVSVLQWSRDPLKYVENDRCHYASVDVPLGKREVVTFLFKSSKPFTEEREYLDVIRSFKQQEKTAEPYIRKIKQTENVRWDENTAAAYEKYFGDASKLQWGIFENNAPIDFTELNKIEKNLDFRFPILLYYTGFMENEAAHPRVATALANAGREGRLVELTLQTAVQSPWKGNMVYDVLDGRYDVFLKNYAKAVADSEYPVLFRLGNEMNGDWCVYSAYHTAKDTEIFKEFYKYVYEVFENAGADNVIWVWNPNGKSFPDFKWNHELCYYPGDDFVDVIGMTSYNTGTYYEGETWIEFDDMYDELYARCVELYEKPLMITEFSSSSVGGDKVAWVENMFQHMKKYDKIKVAIWWDGCDWDAEGNVARPYFIDETDKLIGVFKKNLAEYK